MSIRLLALRTQLFLHYYSCSTLKLDILLDGIIYLYLQEDLPGSSSPCRLPLPIFTPTLLFDKEYLVVKMNALRTLPILNRPSRPTSPAPSTAQVNTTSAVGSSAPGLSQVRSRSLSRNLADKVAGMQINGSVPPPTNGLTPQHTGSGKKSPSPPTSHPPTPRNIAAPLPGPANGDIAPPTAYMDVISSRLNESVNKATAGLDFKQKKGIKKYTGWNVGEAVVK